MESQCSGLVSSAILRRARLNRTSPEDTIQTAELAKWQAVELFKVGPPLSAAFDAFLNLAGHGELSPDNSSGRGGQCALDGRRCRSF